MTADELSDQRSQRASAEADNVVKPVTHKLKHVPVVELRSQI
jgi:hypothetical protein